MTVLWNYKWHPEPVVTPTIPNDVGPQKPGNLALCRRTDLDVRCLYWQDINRPFEDYMRVVPFQVNNQGELEPKWVPPNNWRYENGLLRAVYKHYATNLCLGPSKNVTRLMAKNCKPYELVLQDCPTSLEDPGGLPNSFGERYDGAMTNNNEQKVISDSARHMRFQMDSEGRIKSLAPVMSFDVDIVADYPYCVTTMKWKGDQHIKTYLMPCIEKENKDREYVNQNHVHSNLMKNITREQQSFYTTIISGYDSFLLSWEDSSSEETIRIAYQTGKERKTHRKDSYELVVKKDGECIKSKGECNRLYLGYNTSGILSMATSDFGVSGDVEIELRGYIPASTSISFPYSVKQSFKQSTASIIFATVLIFVGFIWFFYLRKLSSKTDGAKKNGDNGLNSNKAMDIAIEDRDDESVSSRERDLEENTAIGTISDDESDKKSLASTSDNAGTSIDSATDSDCKALERK